MARYRLLVGPFLVVSVLVSAAVAGSAAEFTPLGDLPGGEFVSRAEDISADGSVVVGASESAVAGGEYEPFRWSASGGMVGLGLLSGGVAHTALAIGVSADGSVIVGNGPAPFRWTAGTGMVAVNDLSTTGFMVHSARDVSADGSVIVGHGLDGSTPPGIEAYRWTAETGAVSIGALSTVVVDSFAFAVSAEGSVVAGQSASTPTSTVEAFHWSQPTGMTGLGTLTVLSLGFSYAQGWGVSADGLTIVGQARTEDFEEAFYWRAEAGMVPMDPLRGTTITSFALDASADGSIIVGFSDGGAMIWDAAHGMRSVQQVLENQHGLDLTEWQLNTVTGISDDGTRLAGNGFNPNGDVEAWVATLPAYCTRRCGDVDGDDREVGGVVDMDDFLAFHSCLGASPLESQACLCSDLNGGGSVNLADYAILTVLFDGEPDGAIPSCAP